MQNTSRLTKCATAGGSWPRSRSACATDANDAAARSVSDCRVSPGRNRSGSVNAHFSRSRVVASARSSSANSCVRLTLFVQFVRIRNRTMSETIPCARASAQLTRPFPSSSHAAITSGARTAGDAGAGTSPRANVISSVEAQPASTSSSASASRRSRVRLYRCRTALPHSGPWPASTARRARRGCGDLRRRGGEGRGRPRRAPALEPAPLRGVGPVRRRRPGVGRGRGDASALLGVEAGEIAGRGRGGAAAIDPP